MSEMKLAASCAAGLEALVAKELKKMGYQVHNENGRVLFKGTVQDIARTNIWLRTADRVKIVMGEFEATSFDDLYEKTKAIAWEEILPPDAEFPVSGKSVKSKLHSVPSIQRITKKAIADRLLKAYHRHNRLPESGAKYPIEVSIHKDQVLLTLDTTGSSLFKRGYRKEKGPAPLKENFAAAMVELTTWFPDRPLYDPTTGSGTIAIEAALIGKNIAPGIQRGFVCESWDIFTDEFSLVRQEAEEVIDQDIQLNIMACDIDQRMVEIAKENAKSAGVADQIHFKQMQVADFKTDREYGIIISNPPYGQRMNDNDYVHNLYQQMGKVYRPLTTWSKYILSSDPDFEKYYGEKATKKRKLYNGALRVDYYQYWGAKN